EGLTNPDEVVLDPMVGSGTTIVEAYFANRKGIGFDIDPLALKIAQVKTTPLNKKELKKYGSKIYYGAKDDYFKNKKKLFELLKMHFDIKTKKFIDYWFLPETQLELISIWNQINMIKEEKYRNFFEVIFSSLIITKSGGVSLALDLGHTRPHKIKALLDNYGNVIYGDKNFEISKKHFVTKIFKSSFEEFRKKLNQNIINVLGHSVGPEPEIKFCDSQNLCLDDETVDLIVTSPPYVSNAIDYMRAHKFSLVWFGYRIEELTRRRNEYIGSEATSNYNFEDLPEFTSKKISDISTIDLNRGKVLKRYFSEMKKSLKEMYRVLKPGKVAIVVIGNSTMKGIDTETHKCLEEIGNSIGFIVPYIGIRQLDRNKRMLPASKKKDLNSQIQKRMHEEYVIGFYKP
ncbi:MAG: site-specific DNA-methyltransferase, partial [Calditrichaeota bacterium]|nr:site-specific DNA-methyltransferase [Calditrichota bacterium]